MGQGWDSIAPDDPNYEEYCAKYGLKKPGDSKRIFRRFIDGEWVEVDEEQQPDEVKSVSNAPDQS